MPKAFKGFTTCSQVSSGFTRLMQIVRHEQLSPGVIQDFLKAKELFTRGKARMKRELEEKNEKKKIAKEAELYGHDETVAGEDPDVAFWDKDDGYPSLSQNSVGSAANSDYSGPTQKMGNPADAD